MVSQYLFVSGTAFQDYVSALLTDHKEKKIQKECLFFLIFLSDANVSQQMNMCVRDKRKKKSFLILPLLKIELFYLCCSSTNMNPM